jgi:hypothetical protein
MALAAMLCVNPGNVLARKAPDTAKKAVEKIGKAAASRVSYEFVHDWKRVRGKAKRTSHTIELNFNDNLKWLTSRLSTELNRFDWPKKLVEKKRFARVSGPPSDASLNFCYDRHSGGSRWRFYWEPKTHRFNANSDSVRVSIKSGEKIDIGLRLPKFLYSGRVTARKKASNRKNVSFLKKDCSKKPNLYGELIKGWVKGLNVDLDLTLGQSGSRLKISKVRDFDLDWGKVATNKKGLEKLVSGMVKVIDWIDDNVWNTKKNNFPNFCKSLTKCANHYTDKLVKSQDLKRKLKTAINEGLTTNLRMKDTISAGDYKVGYGVALSSMSTTSGSIQTRWNLKITSRQSSSRCALGLEKPTLTGADATRARGDIDVVLPYSLVADAIYRAGKQGLFCGRLVRTAMIKGKPPKTTLFSVQPHGEFTVTGQRGTVIVTLPVKLSSDFSSDIITAELRMKMSVDTTCDGGLALKPHNVKIQNASGKIQFLGKVWTAEDFMKSPYKSQIERLANSRLSRLDLTAPVSDIGYVKVQSVRVGPSALAVGLDASASKPDRCKTKSKKRRRSRGGKPPSLPEEDEVGRGPKGGNRDDDDEQDPHGINDDRPLDREEEL